MYELIGLFVFVGISALFSILAFWRAGQLRDLFNDYPSVDNVAENVANTLDKAQKDVLAQYQRSLKDAQNLIDELRKRLGI
jgi:hypothetical protein